MAQLQERMCSGGKGHLNGAPISVYILLFICMLYAAARFIFLVFGILFSFTDGFGLYSFISGILTDFPWACMVFAGAIGLWRRRVWGWAIWLVISLWFICSSIPTIDVLVSSLIPTFEIIAYFIFFLLLTPGVRKWCRVDFTNCFRWLSAVLTFFLGWIWCSVVLQWDYLPPDIAGIDWLMVMCSLICWLFYWSAAYWITKRKAHGIIFSVLASAFSTITLVVSLLVGWPGLQQRVLWAFSTIFGAGGLWISVRESLLMLSVILIAVNLIIAFMVIMFRKRILTKCELADESIKTEEGEVSEVEEEALRERKVGWDVVLAVIALIVAGLQAADLFLLGLGLGGYFILYGAMGLSVLGPAALIVMLLRVGRNMEQMNRKARVLRGVLLICLLLVGAFYVFSPGFMMSYLPTDLGMRLKVSVTGGVDELQKWAVDILESPQEEVVETESTTSIKKELYSEQVKRLCRQYVFISTGWGDEIRHIKISWGGGFHHWGILIGPSSFKTGNNERQHVYRWCDGVYGYHEIQ
jgi:hypothetical protein